MDPLERGRWSGSFYIHFRPERAADILEKFPELKRLLTPDILNGEGRINGRAVPINEVCRHALKNMLLSRRAGDPPNITYTGRR